MWFQNVTQNKVKDLPDYQGITVGLRIVEVLGGADIVSSQSWNHFVQAKPPVKTVAEFGKIPRQLVRADGVSCFANGLFHIGDRGVHRAASFLRAYFPE